MKSRSGFVSNSSSSSFVVAYKDNFLSNFKGAVIDRLEDSPMKDIANDICECFFDNINKTYNEISDYLEDEDRYYTNEKIIQWLKDGFIVSEGSISDESDYDKIDNYLCHKGFSIESKNLIVYFSGGY